MEIVVYTREVKRRRWNRSGGSDFDIGGNINHLLWGEYKVYRVKICGQIELDIQ